MIDDLSITCNHFAAAGFVFPFSDIHTISSTRWSPDHSAWKWPSRKLFDFDSFLICVTFFAASPHLLVEIYDLYVTRVPLSIFSWGQPRLFGHVGQTTNPTFPLSECLRLRSSTLYGPCKSFPACTPWALRFSPLQHGSNRLSGGWAAAACGLLDAFNNPFLLLLNLPQILKTRGRSQILENLKLANLSISIDPPNKKQLLKAKLLFVGLPP